MGVYVTWQKISLTSQYQCSYYWLLPTIFIFHDNINLHLPREPPPTSILRTFMIFFSFPPVTATTKSTAELPTSPLNFRHHRWYIQRPTFAIELPCQKLLEGTWNSNFYLWLLCFMCFESNTGIFIRIRSYLYNQLFSLIYSPPFCNCESGKEKCINKKKEGSKFMVWDLSY